MAHAAHPTPEGAPNVVAHLPAGLDRSRPFGLVVFLHGWNGCARVLAGSGQLPCREGGRDRTGWGLAARHDEAGSQSILVVPQLAWTARTGDPGRFAEAGFAEDFLRELLGDTLADALGGPRPVGDVERVTLVAHSAGYETALAWLEHGEALPIRGVALLDALYGEADRFASWLEGGTARRILSLHGGRGDTARQSARLARRAGEMLGEDAVAVDPDGGFPAAMRQHRVVVAETRVPHGAIPMRQLTDVLRGFDLPARDVAPRGP